MITLNDDCKKKCQIFTPEIIVKKMLDWLNYRDNLYGKKIIEPSCGQGNILIEIVERYIKDSRRNSYTDEQICLGLSNDIYAIEYDYNHYKICIENLNKILKKYKIGPVEWKVFCNDFLEMKINIKFDYVVGNPPYISYKMLDESTRNFVRKKFVTCQNGKFDYCYPFIEKGVNILKNKGKISFLIPGSIFKNVFSKNLREFLRNDITNIYDFATQKIFNEYATGEKKKILTSSIVFILEKGCNKDDLCYFNLDYNNSEIIKKKNLSNKWIFNPVVLGEKKFGDYFKVSNSIATLYNDAYIISETDELFNDITEKKIIKNAVSPKSIELGRKEKIIFPYYFDLNGNIKKISEKIFHDKYPNVENHLKKYSKELINRKSDKNISWFEYGRSQALKDMNCKKILLSIIVTGKVKPYFLPKTVIPYSGIYIVPKKDLSLKYAKSILESKEFFEYIKSVGINASGDSYRITSKDISNYYF